MRPASVQSDSGSRPHVVLEMPPAPPPLTRGQKAASWVADGIHQSAVSSISWGLFNKAPGLIGTALGTAAGGPVGGAVGGFLGEVAGGAAMGVAHLAVDSCCGKARVALAKCGNDGVLKGVGMKPSTNEPKAASWRRNTFVGTFALFAAAKAVGKAALVGSAWQVGAAGLAMDMVSSGAAGAVAQTLTNTRKVMMSSEPLEYVEVKPAPLTAREFKIRAAAGTIAGAVAGTATLGSALSACAAKPAVASLVPGAADLSTTAAVSAALGSREVDLADVGKGAVASVKTTAVLYTWMGVRDDLKNGFPATPKDATRAAQNAASQSAAGHIAIDIDAPSSPDVNEEQPLTGQSSPPVAHANGSGPSLHLDIENADPTPHDSQRPAGSNGVENVAVDVELHHLPKPVASNGLQHATVDIHG